MKQHEFAKGMTMGVMAGAAMGVMLAPRKRTNVKKAAEKAMKTVGQVMEDLSDEMVDEVWTFLAGGPFW